MMRNTKLSVIIPTKNEVQTLSEVIRGCRKYSDELIVVDGNSTDGTRELAQSLDARIYLDNGLGKGDAIRVGFKHVTGDIVVLIDADGSHDPDDIPKLVQPILDGAADHVTGSRMRGGSDELHGDIEKFIRMIGSNIITMGINYRFNVLLTDSQNGFRALKSELVRKLDLKENITTIEQEMIIKTLRLGYRMAEVPAHEYERQAGRSHICLRRVAARYVYSWLKYLLQ